MIRALIVCVVLMGAKFALAYPEFIGYGYSSCVACHFNGLGGGSLNDYGRAVWAGELTSHALVDAHKTDEEVGKSSGFLGDKALPWWIRPSLKTRNLWNNSSLGTKNSKVQSYYMQGDATIVLTADRENKYLFSYTQGYRPSDQTDPTHDFNRFLARDYFVRINFLESYWIYAGLVDKVFGIRNVDHTSYTRTYQKLTQTDQSQSIILQRTEANWEFAGSWFVGNADEEKSSRQRGGSILGEYELSENNRLGLSALSSESDIEKLQLYAVSYRLGIGKGSSLQFEYGLRHLRLDSDSNWKSGSWTMLNMTTLLTRGYHLHFIAERYNEEFRSSSPDLWKWNLGILAFPFPRFELRTDLVCKKSIKETGGSDEDWSLQGQIHVSL